MMIVIWHGLKLRHSISKLIFVDNILLMVVVFLDNILVFSHSYSDINLISFIISPAISIWNGRRKRWRGRKKGRRKGHFYFYFAFGGGGRKLWRGGAVGKQAQKPLISSLSLLCALPFSLSLPSLTSSLSLSSPKQICIYETPISSSSYIYVCAFILRSLY